MRKLCYKTTITGISPIENADRLEVAGIRGWRVVVGKGEFKEGDTVLFFEIDSALNANDTRFEFLKDRCLRQFKIGDTLVDQCIRIRSMKLRGVVSQGLVAPCSTFYEVRSMPLEEDCSALLGVRHYDEVQEATRRLTGKVVAADQKGSFPSFIPKTDEERIQNLDQALLEKLKDEPLECTVKRDGSSMTVFYAAQERPGDPFGLCSRNFELKPGLGTWWKPVEAHGLQEKLAAWCTRSGIDIAIQGELVGPGVNNNRDMLEDHDWHVFRVWNITERRWLTWDERYSLCRDLGLPHVPVIGTYTIGGFGRDRDRMLAFADGTTENGHPREGLVWKSNDGTFSFKTVSNAYLLKEKDN